jgi:AraC-like DNA-binding protein
MINIVLRFAQYSHAIIEKEGLSIAFWIDKDSYAFPFFSYSTNTGFAILMFISGNKKFYTFRILYCKIIRDVTTGTRVFIRRFYMVKCFVGENNFMEEKVEEPSLYYISKVTPKDNAYPRILHAHEDFVEIVLICSGEAIFMINGKHYPVKAGDLVIYNSKNIHDELVEPGNNFSSLCCAVKGMAIKGLRINALVSDDEIPIFSCGEYYPTLHSLASHMFQMLCLEYPGGEESCYYLLKAYLLQVQHVIDESHHLKKTEGYDRKDAQNSLANRVKNYIDKYYYEEISLKSISEELNISLYYMAHVFKQVWGYSPKQYMIRRRIGEAQTLLIGTELTIINIANRVGFSDSSHFNTLFAKNAGMSPRVYRKTYQNKEKEQQEN